jgi:hypothetical protein
MKGRGGTAVRAGLPAPRFRTIRWRGVDEIGTVDATTQVLGWDRGDGVVAMHSARSLSWVNSSSGD